MARWKFPLITSPFTVVLLDSCRAGKGVGVTGASGVPAYGTPNNSIRTPPVCVPPSIVVSAGTTGSGKVRVNLNAAGAGVGEAGSGIANAIESAPAAAAAVIASRSEQSAASHPPVVSPSATRLTVKVAADVTLAVKKTMAT